MQNVLIFPCEKKECLEKNHFSPQMKAFKIACLQDRFLLEDRIMSMFFDRTNLPTVADMRGISRLHDEIDRLFGGFPGRTFWPAFEKEEKALLPQVDLKSDDKQYTLSVELPGVAPEEVKIEVTGRELTISGEKKEEVMDEAKTHVQERRYGSFARSMTLPEDADADSIRAVARNGVLTLEIARKATGADKARSIEVQKA